MAGVLHEPHNVLYGRLKRSPILWEKWFSYLIFIFITVNIFVVTKVIEQDFFSCIDMSLTRLICNKINESIPSLLQRSQSNKVFFSSSYFHLYD